MSKPTSTVLTIYSFVTTFALIAVVSCKFVDAKTQEPKATAKVEVKDVPPGEGWKNVTTHDRNAPLYTKMCEHAAQRYLDSTYTSYIFETLTGSLYQIIEFDDQSKFSIQAMRGGNERFEMKRDANLKIESAQVFYGGVTNYDLNGDGIMDTIQYTYPLAPGTENSVSQQRPTILPAKRLIYLNHQTQPVELSKGGDFLRERGLNSDQEFIFKDGKWQAIKK